MVAHHCPSHPCPICFPHLVGGPTIGISYPVQPAQAGCICPPTSEQTCMNPVCPRKGYVPTQTLTSTGNSR